MEMAAVSMDTAAIYAEKQAVSKETVPVAVEIVTVSRDTPRRRAAGSGGRHR